MGGRMSGESPREEKVAARNCGVGALRPYQAKEGDVIVIATTARQTSRQQLSVYDPLGQHGLCETSEGLSAEVWQSGCINGATAVNATRDPCRPIASITMRAMS
jgi:hypothetical protein